MKIGLLINPIAGMGGAVGLKGTDGQLSRALKLGASPRAEGCTVAALRETLPLCDRFVMYCGGGLMGQTAAEQLGLPVAGVASGAAGSLSGYSREDSRSLCRWFLENKIDLLVFSGGDGTARDVLDIIGGQIPVVAIPSGVKMHSGVFAAKPFLAGRMLARRIKGELQKTALIEVMDLDEELYRQGIIAPRLYGYLKTPYDTKTLQGKKSRSQPGEQAEQQSIAWDIADTMDSEALYLIGPGSSTARITETLGIGGTLIGFDAVHRGKLIKSDLGERDILLLAKDFPPQKRRLILTPVGGQGILLGRGNQQASPEVLWPIPKENIQVVATKSKLAALKNRPLLLDTGDEELNRHLAGYYRISTGYREYTIYKVH